MWVAVQEFANGVQVVGPFPSKAKATEYKRAHGMWTVAEVEEPLAEEED